MTTQGTTWAPDLHLRLARRYALDVRGTRAGAAALALSVLAWVLGLDTTVHATLMVAGAALAAALPVSPPLPRAFGWIGRQAGLAYQTHVEHVGRTDPFGLLAEAAVQARLTVRGVAPPPRSPWWLPLAATALAVWLVAAVAGGLGTVPGARGTGGGVPEATPPPVTELHDEPEPLDAGADGDEDPDETTTSAPPSDGGRDGGAHGDAPAGEASEGETFERYLDNLRERTAVAEERETAVEREAQRDGVREEDPEGGRQEAGPDEEDGDRQGTLQPAPDDEEGDGDTLESEVPAGGESRPGDDDGIDAAGTPSDEGDEGDDGDLAEDPDGEPGREPGDDDGDGEQEAGAPGGDDPGFDAGAGDEAGTGRGAPAEQEATELEPGGDPEALPGMLLPGTETPGGRVRLPGRDEGHLPEGSTVERYERAVEQAITDGTVPVPYQEIIRNYFR